MHWVITIIRYHWHLCMRYAQISYDIRQASWQGALVLSRVSEWDAFVFWHGGRHTTSVVPIIILCWQLYVKNRTNDLLDLILVMNRSYMIVILGLLLHNHVRRMQEMCMQLVREWSIFIGLLSIHNKTLYSNNYL